LRQQIRRVTLTAADVERGNAGLQGCRHLWHERYDLGHERAVECLLVDALGRFRVRASSEYAARPIPYPDG
jgi:hypothetical protein